MKNMFVVLSVMILSGQAFAFGNGPAKFSCSILDFENSGHGNVLQPTTFEIQDDQSLDVMVYDQKKFVVRYTNMTSPSDSEPKYELSLSVRDPNSDKFMFGAVNSYSLETPTLRLLAGGGIIFSCKGIN